MRILRVLLALSLSALAMVAVVAPASLAQEEPVEVLEEPENEHCADDVTVTNHVVTGGCRIHAVMPLSTFRTFAHIPGVGEVLTHNCKNEFVARIGAGGEGWISGINFTNPVGGSGCGGVNGLRACTEPGGAQKPWHIQLYEDGITEDLFALIELCVITGLGEVSGDIRMDIFPIGGGQYGFEIIDKPLTETTATNVEVEAHWEPEAVNFRIVH
jgi:hypothetical protein